MYIVEYNVVGHNSRRLHAIHNSQHLLHCLVFQQDLEWCYVDPTLINKQAYHKYYNQAPILIKQYYFIYSLQVVHELRERQADLDHHSYPAKLIN